MASIDDVMAAIADVHNILSYLATKGIKGSDVSTPGGVSDIDTYLGLITSGEFRSGNGYVPGKGFTGIRSGYPGFVYDGTTWVWAGVESDVIQVGVSLDDGKLLAGGGAVILDANGIDASAGTIGGWVLGTDTFQSVNYAAGLSGARIRGSDGNAEFNNITARGAITASVFEKNGVTLTAGSFVVAKSAGKLRLTCYVNNAGTTEVDIEDPASGHVALFAVNDILCLNDGIHETWLTVTSVSDQTTFYAYYCSFNSGDEYDYPEGTIVADYGVAGDGFLLMTADDTNAPFYSVRTHAGEPWATLTEPVRLGNLNGFLSYVTDIYGIGIGDSVGYMTYDPTNGFTIGFADGNATIGANGILINQMGYLIQHTATDGTITRTGSFGMWATPGDTEPQYGMNISSPGGDELVVNGDASAGDFTGWTKTTETNGAWSIANGGFKWTPNTSGTNSGVLTSDAISVDASVGHYGSFTRYFGAGTGMPDGTTNWRLKLYLLWYNAGATLIRTDTAYDSGSVTSSTGSGAAPSFSVLPPVGAATVKFQFVAMAQYVDADSYGYVSVDNASFKATTINESLFFDHLGNLNYTNGLFPKSVTVSMLALTSTATLTTHIDGYKYTHTADANDGDVHTLLIPPIEAGTYTVYFTGQKTTASGKLDWTLDGTSITTGQDWYAGTAANFVFAVANVTVGYSGQHTLVGTINGKNASSSDYRIIIYSVTFVRTA